MSYLYDVRTASSSSSSLYRWNPIGVFRIVFVLYQGHGPVRRIHPIGTYFLKIRLVWVKNIAPQVRKKKPRNDQVHPYYIGMLLYAGEVSTRHRSCRWRHATYSLVVLRVHLQFCEAPSPLEA